MHKTRTSLVISSLFSFCSLYTFNSASSWLHMLAIVLRAPICSCGSSSWRMNGTINSNPFVLHSSFAPKLRQILVNPPSTSFPPTYSSMIETLLRAVTTARRTFGSSEEFNISRSSGVPFCIITSCVFSIIYVNFSYLSLSPFVHVTYYQEPSFRAI